MRAIALDVRRLSIRELYIMVRIVRLVDAGIYFGAVQESAELI
jgi:hypothetical protein